MRDFFGEFHRKYIVEPTGERVGDKFVDLATDIGRNVWEWFVHSIPDLAGYGTMAAGGAIILGSMVGRGGLMKPLAYLAGGLIVAVCILEVA